MATKKIQGNGTESASPPPAEIPAEAAAEQQPKLTEEQQYLQDLFERAKAGEVSAEQKIMIEMLAESEQKIAGATEKANSLDRQIYELQVQRQQLQDAINRERGVASGMAEALLKMKPETKTTRKKSTKRSSKSAEAVH